MQREKLFQRIDKGREKPVIWISGPGGSGKTTLAASYLESRKIPCLWYQVDEGDGDIGSFFYYLGMAAAKAHPANRKPLPLLSPDYSLGIATFTQRFFEALFNRFKHPFVLIFDNYQNAPAEAAFHSALNIGASMATAGLTVMFLSRVDPPPFYAKLKADRKMEFVGWEQTRFSLGETREMIQANGRIFSPAAIASLHRETDGWAAALVLMLEKMRINDVSSPDALQLPRDDIFEYFAGEIFSKIQVEIQFFLLRTSVLPFVTPAMAEKLTGSGQAEKILRDLHRRHFFITRHSRERAYQYHPLFREFLLARAKETLPREALGSIRKKAAALLEEAAQMEDAAQLFIEAADWEGLTGLIMKNARTLLIEGRSRTLEAWLGYIPEDTLHKNPWLLYWTGSCVMMLNPAQAREHFEAAFELFTKEDDQSGLFLTWASIVDTFMYEWRDFHPLDRWIDELESLVKRYRNFLSGEIEDIVTCSMFGALMFRQPHHRELLRWQAKAEAVMHATQNKTLKMSVANNLIYYNLWIGQVDAAGVIVDSLSHLFKRASAPSLAQLMWFSAEALYSVYAAQYQRGLAAITKGLAIADASGIHLIDIIFYGRGIYNTLLLGDVKTAAEFLEKMASSMNANSCFANILYHHMASLLAMHREDFSLSIRYAEICLSLSKEAGCPFMDGIYQFALDSILFWAGKTADLPRHMAEIRNIALPTQSKSLELCCAVLETLWAISTNDSKKMNKHLHDVLTLQKSTGCKTILYHGYRRTDLLCAKALEAGIEVEYVRELVRCHQILLDPNNARLENWPWALKVRTLGHFELLKDDKTVSLSGKVQKPLELLKALIAFGGENVPESRLSEALWPATDGDLAHRAFDTTLHRLRKLLANDQMLILKGGKLSLNPSFCWTDTKAFERFCSEIDTRIKETAHQKDPVGMQQLFERAIGLYRGHFLPTDMGQPWATWMRENQRNRFSRMMLKAGGYREEQNQWEKATEWYWQGLQIDNLAEPFYQRLMVCYEKQGQRSEAARVYQQCRSILADTMDLAPSPKTEEIFNGITQKKFYPNDL